MVTIHKYEIEPDNKFKVQIPIAKETIDKLDAMGANEWELVSVIQTIAGQYVYFFKKPLREKQ